MTDVQVVITVLILAASVWITRFLPFLIFSDTGRLPKTVEYLGKVLPAAMMGLLVVYCFKDYDFLNYREILPAVIAVGATVGIHLWRRNTILSIATGTAAYMILIRVF